MFIERKCVKWCYAPFRMLLLYQTCNALVFMFNAILIFIVSLMFFEFCYES
ncbi:hypothetical protein WN943_011377 [Citrus x changshan-huyou]